MKKKKRAREREREKNWMKKNCRVRNSMHRSFIHKFYFYIFVSFFYMSISVKLFDFSLAGRFGSFHQNSKQLDGSEVCARNALNDLHGIVMRVCAL